MKEDLKVAWLVGDYAMQQHKVADCSKSLGYRIHRFYSAKACLENLFEKPDLILWNEAYMYPEDERILSLIKNLLPDSTVLLIPAASGTIQEHSLRTEPARFVSGSSALTRLTNVLIQIDKSGACE